MRAVVACWALLALAACSSRDKGPVAPVLTPEEALSTFRLPDGYRIELVAAEPMVQDPVAIDFDADGRMYVVEMRGFMPNINGTGEDRPIGRIVVLEDRNDDGRMDTSIVFLDSLVLPRTVKVLEHGVLVGETPNLWLARDTTGDLRADTRVLVRDDYGMRASNPEHNANSAYWGLDNWLHTANYTSELRLRADGGFDARPTASLGQWGVAGDDYGRLYRNSNEDPLRTDFIPAHYASRAGSVPAHRGVYERLTANVPVYPGHKTPAVNRGYREETLRPDSTLAHYTSAGSPTPYVGDRLPDALHHSVFVTESAGNLVGEFTVADSSNGGMFARRASPERDFLTSTDERFRPVNLANAPDGTLYVVDMYRGIIQHRAYITDYLEQKIRERGLEQPVGRGRIYRIVHESKTRGATPRLSKLKPAQLVEELSHPNGWRRLMAQQLLVERGDRGVAPALRALAASARDDRVRLHALWTLDGLGSADDATLRRALADSSAAVRTAAVRMLEPRIRAGTGDAMSAVMALVQDRAIEVRRQVAATLGETPTASRTAVLERVLAVGDDDAVIADLVASAAGGRAMALLAYVVRTPSPNQRSATVNALASVAVADRQALPALVTMASDSNRVRWQRLAIMAGMTRAARGKPGPLEIAPAPTALLAVATGNDSVLAERAQRVLAMLHWPGKPVARADSVRALTPAEELRVAEGQKEFKTNCSGCHLENGTGLPGTVKTLVASPLAIGSPLRAIRVVLQGKEGVMLMPPVGASMTDDQVAATLTYLRRAWGNSAEPIDAAQVHEIRGATSGRKRAWTEEELARINR